MSLSQIEKQEVIDFLSKGQVPGTRGSSRQSIQRFKKFARQFHLREPTGATGSPSLFCGSRLVVSITEAPKYLKNAYFDNPETGLVGRDKFYARISKRFFGITKEMISDFLRNLEVNQVHKTIPKARVVKPIISKSKNERWQCDLIDFTSHEYWNNSYSWILIVIDHFTKYAWAFVLKNKGMQTVAKELEPILFKHQPKILQSDNGSEFCNEVLEAIVAKTGTKQIFSSPYKPNSNGAIESFVKTLKRMIYKFFTTNKTKIWINILDSLVLNYNTSKHSTTQLEPQYLYKTRDNRVLKKAQDKIRTKAEKMKGTTTGQVLPKVGDWVRLSSLVVPIARKNRIFNKGYKQTYLTEIYHIVNKVFGQFVLKDEAGEELKSHYWPNELQVIDKDKLVKGVPIKHKATHFDREKHLRRVATATPVRENTLPEVEEEYSSEVKDSPIAVRRSRRTIQKPLRYR